MRHLLIATLLLTSMAYATKRHLKPDTRVFIPTREAQVEQNRVIDQYNLRRIENEAELAQAILQGTVVKIIPSSRLMVSDKIPKLRQAALPSTVRFLNQIAQQFYDTFKQPLLVTSAVRPLTVQRRLLRWNKNAAPLVGEIASSHPTGATVDISRRHMTAAQNKFMEQLLLEYAIRNRVIVLEEEHQACFHVFIIPTKEPLNDY